MNSNTIEDKILVLISEKISKLLNRFSESELDEIASGNFTLELKIQSKKQSSRPRKGSPPTQLELESMVESLKSFTSRVEGADFLKANFAQRDKLEMLSRHLRLPVQKHYKVDMIIDRIIESTIGYKLSSNAIRGKSD